MAGNIGNAANAECGRRELWAADTRGGLRNGIKLINNGIISTARPELMEAVGTCRPETARPELAQNAKLLIIGSGLRMRIN